RAVDVPVDELVAPVFRQIRQQCLGVGDRRMDVAVDRAGTHFHNGGSESGPPATAARVPCHTGSGRSMATIRSRSGVMRKTRTAPSDAGGASRWGGSLTRVRRRVIAKLSFAYVFFGKPL